MTSREPYRALVEGLRTTALVGLDPDGRIESWNPGAENLYGYPVAEAVGHDFDLLFSEADARVGGPARMLATAAAEGSTVEECWVVVRDGARQWAEVAVNAIPVGDPRPRYVVAVRDTGRSRAALDMAAAANRRLGDASRLKSDFLAKMSHELRTPLTAMLGFSDVLLRGLDGELSDLQQEDVARIRRSGLSILALVNDILDLAKIESGRMTLRQETVDVGRLIGEAVGALEKLAVDKGIYLVTELPAAAVEAYADPLRVHQVLTNLVANAVKFTDAGGVTVRVMPGPADLRVEVRDTGVGVPPEALAMIWDEFRQGETGSRSHTGTGLGLAISRRLVNMQGGSIGVDPAAEGGSTFWFTLPRAPAESTSVANGWGVDTLAVPEDDRELILVVEDDDATRNMISRRLKTAGFRTVEARDGAQAIRAARELRPDLVTLDMVMPGVDGWSVLAALRDDPRTREIPVLVASIIEDREMAINLGAADYVPKPFLLDDLLAVVERLLTSAESRILVVDDDDEVLDLVERSLAAAGMEVSRASDGAEALAMSAAAAYDLVVTDLVMPGMSGFELIARLRSAERTRDTPIVVFTGKEIEAVDRAELDGEVRSLLSKADFAPADLVTTIRASLGSRAPV